LDLAVLEDLKPEEETLRVGEIRWCSLGVNVGSEIDGKGERFLRPCLVIGIFSTRLALVVPLSTKIKNIPGYVGFTFNGAEYSACVMQTKTISQKRIFEREGKMNDNNLKLIITSFKNFYRI
jgi:mRNA interferase MazF